jgi:hypothetical protein
MAAGAAGARRDRSSRRSRFVRLPVSRDFFGNPSRRSPPRRHPPFTRRSPSRYARM